MRVDIKQKTKIVSTLGPASSDYETIKALVSAGVDVFRLNFSHGKHEDKTKVIKIIQRVNAENSLHVGILADLQGPKLRVGEMEGEGLKLTPGMVLTFSNTKCVGNAEKIYMSYERFALDVEAGDRVLLDDGNVVLKVLETNGVDEVKLTVIHGMILKSNKGVNLPDTDVSLPALTEKDLVDLKYILTQPFNWIALSFVRRAADMHALRKYVDDAGHPAKLMAKIEKPQAVKRIKKIIKASNGIMIARGDLGVEMPIEKLPSIQKKIIKHCIQWARPVVVATQMMESMITNPSPTRAEITDVANAVLDGADALMLSGETAVGKFPVQVIKYMNKIINEMEKSSGYTGFKPKPIKKSSLFFSDVICFNAALTANDIGAVGVAGVTVSGYTAFKVSSFRPKGKIFIFSSEKELLGSLALCWGVKPFYYDSFTSTDDMIKDTARILKETGYVKAGDTIVNTASIPIGERGKTNMLKVNIIK